MNTVDLTGITLEYAFALACGYEPEEVYKYPYTFAEDIPDKFPLQKFITLEFIEHHGVTVCHGRLEFEGWYAEIIIDDTWHTAYGVTAIEAIAKAYVSVKLGDTVSMPLGVLEFEEDKINAQN